MRTIHIGSDSEYVAMHIPNNLNINEWHNVQVVIAVQGFSGRISIAAEPEDILEFLRGLQNLYATLKGEVKFSHIEDQFNLTLTVNKTGSIYIEGYAWAYACYGSKLIFSLTCDQTYLTGAVNEIVAFEDSRL